MLVITLEGPCLNVCVGGGGGGNVSRVAQHGLDVWENEGE
jgi:hypothetical protein